MSVLGIHCIIDPHNYLRISPNGGGDVALSTERFVLEDDADHVSHMSCATLRTWTGGGRYARPFVDEKGTGIKTLHAHFFDLMKESWPDRGVIPTFEKTQVINNWDITAPVDILTFPSDDGVNEQFHLLKKGDLLGIQTSHRHYGNRENREIVVWLGDVTEKPLLNNIWTRAEQTQIECQKYYDVPSMQRRTMPVSTWVM